MTLVVQRRAHACRVPMKKIASSDRTDLALRKKSCDRNWSQAIGERFRVMVQSTEQSLSASTATEQQGAEWSIGMHRAVCGQQQVQILARRLGITQVELHGLAFLNHVSNRDGAGGLISPDEITDEKVSPLKMVPMFIQDNADMQRPVSAPAVFSVQRFKHRL